MLGHPLALESEVGRGTAFRVTVPLAEPVARRPDRGPAARRRAGPPSGWRHEGLVAVVVENDLDMRRALAHLLGNWDVAVIDAGGGAEALARIEESGLAPGRAAGRFPARRRRDRGGARSARCAGGSGPCPPASSPPTARPR